MRRYRQSYGLTDAVAASVTCMACGAGVGDIIGTWEDWVAVCGRRADGPMRLAAAEAAGVAKTRPSMWQCGECGSAQMTIVPSADQLSSFYANYHATDDFVRKADKKVIRALRRVAFFRLQGASGPFLEVGGSIGTAAEAARRLGMDAHVQEIDPDAVHKGRDLFSRVTFHQGFLDEVSASDPFGMVYCAEVIEHVPDPLSFAREMYDRLVPGGWLFVTTPDAGHPKRTEPLMEWEPMRPPEHITLFTQDGLRTLMETAGYSRVRFYPYAKPGIRMSARKPT